MKESHKAIETLAEAVVLLTSIVEDLDPGKTEDIKAIRGWLEKTASHMIQARVFER
jgi:hypothetical protein